MGQVRDIPIRSERADEPDFEESLDAFVVELGERVDLLQEAERMADLPQVVLRARALAADARVYGFPPLLRAARQTEECAEAGDAQGARKGIVELTDVVRRIRLGHRGAA